MARPKPIHQKIQEANPNHIQNKTFNLHLAEPTNESGYILDNWVAWLAGALFSVVVVGIVILIVTT